LPGTDEHFINDCYILTSDVKKWTIPMVTASPARDSKVTSISGPADFRLGEVSVYTASGKVSGPGGTRHLDPKVVDVLRRLVAAQGEVVSRESLMTDVWEGLVVTDFALSRCIYQLRRNLCRAAGTKDSPIETLPKRGYRLTWPVAGPADIPARAKKTRWLPITAAAIALISATVLIPRFAREPLALNRPRPAIAVLPFKDLTGSGELGYFGDGIAMAVRTELGHVPEIDVIAGVSSSHWGDAGSSVREIGKALDADYVLEGSVTSEGEAIQVTAALADAADGRQIWSRTFTGISGRAFSAQQDVATGIAGFLNVSIGNPRPHGGTTRFEALEAYLRAIQTQDPDLIDYFVDQSLVYDPQYAQALVAKAYAIYLRLWRGERAPETAWAEARPYLERALEISEELSGAHVLIAGFQIFREEYAIAESALNRALEINPSDSFAFVHLSRLMERTGRLQEAVALADRNVRLDPLNPFRHLQLANRLWTAGDFEGGKASYERALELDPLNYAAWRDYAFRLSNRDGEIAGFRLLARLQKNPEFRSLFKGKHPEIAPSGIEVIALWLGFMGDFDRELEMLQLQSRLADNSNLHRELAWNYMTRGDLKAAEQESWTALEGMPKEPIVNTLLAYLALRSGTGADQVLGHYREYWPGLFDTPPSLDHVPEKVVISAALLLHMQAEQQPSIRLLEGLSHQSGIAGDTRAMALAHLGETKTALAALKTHVDSGGYFSYQPGDPFWEPVANEPGFLIIVDAEERKDAQARAELDAMIAGGELILPGYEGS